MSNTALLIIDLQNDYFPSFSGAKWPLEDAENAVKNAQKLLSSCRDKTIEIIHVRHENPTDEAPFFLPKSEGAHIHHSVSPLSNESVVVKFQANSFRDTNLKQLLDEKNIKNLIIVGAMSNMCIDAVTRAAADYGYNCSVAHDACAAMPLEINDIPVTAQQVNAAFMGGLALGYAKVATTEELINEL